MLNFNDNLQQCLDSVKRAINLVVKQNTTRFSGIKLGDEIISLNDFKINALYEIVNLHKEYRNSLNDVDKNISIVIENKSLEKAIIGLIDYFVISKGLSRIDLDSIKIDNFEVAISESRLSVEDVGYTFPQNTIMTHRYDDRDLAFIVIETMLYTVEQNLCNDEIDWWEITTLFKIYCYLKTTTSSDDIIDYLNERAVIFSTQSK